MLTPWVFSDEVGALNYALSIMQALYARERTGRGQHVETSQLGATVAFQYYGMAAALFDPEHRQRDDGKSPNDVGVVRIVAECSDGKWIVTLPNTEKQWRGFTDALERPELYEQAPGLQSWPLSTALQILPAPSSQALEWQPPPWTEDLVNVEAGPGALRTPGEDDANEVMPEAEDAAEFEPQEDHDDAKADAWGRQYGLA